MISRVTALHAVLEILVSVACDRFMSILTLLLQLRVIVTVCQTACQLGMLVCVTVVMPCHAAMAAVPSGLVC